MLSLQHDTGRWCTEYTWSAEDGMWGVRTLHNFGRAGTSSEAADEGEGEPAHGEAARSPPAADAPKAALDEQEHPPAPALVVLRLGCPG